MPKLSGSIAVSAGEVSGDMHAAHVVKSIKLLGISDVFGMGGSHLRAQGMRTIIDSESEVGGTMGFAEIARRLPKIIRSMRLFREELIRHQPSALLLVDYPGFNLRLAKIAHRLKIPVFYFIIPKMWLWKAGRIELFKRYISRSFTIFPFEHEWLEKRGFSRDLFVGHPIQHQIAERPIDRIALRERLGIAADQKLLAILPGSRSQELRYHLPLVVEVVALLRRSQPEVKIVIPIAASQRDNPLWKAAQIAGIQLSDLSSLDIMRAADVGLIKSGTSTLEAVACELPSIMIYKTGATTAFLVRQFIRKSDYSLPNIVRSGTMLEIIQEQATPVRIVSEIERLLLPQERKAELAKYREMMQVLIPPTLNMSGVSSPYDRVAREILAETHTM